MSVFEHFWLDFSTDDGIFTPKWPRNLILHKILSYYKKKNSGFAWKLTELRHIYIIKLCNDGLLTLPAQFFDWRRRIFPKMIPESDSTLNFELFGKKE